MRNDAELRRARGAVDAFWRTTAQQEIDYVEEQNGVFTAYEMKWNIRRRSTVTMPKSFAEAYDVKEINVVTPENYLDIVS